MSDTSANADYASRLQPIVAAVAAHFLRRPSDPKHRPQNSPRALVTRLRRPTLTHAFERALDDARFDAPPGAIATRTPISPKTRRKISDRAETLPEFAAIQYVAARWPRRRSRPRHRSLPRELPAAAHRAAAAGQRPQPMLRPVLRCAIQRLRRLYALDNHPDRVLVEMREEAAQTAAGPTPRRQGAGSARS
jgi:hypothetical protein